jgi:hypothetical protein
VIEKYIFLANLRIGHERVIGKFWNRWSSRLKISKILAI